MSGYVGRGINYGNAATDHFTGNGGATYTLNYDTTTDGVIVSLDGVVQKNGTDFNVTSGTSLVFTSVVASPIAIQVVYTGLTLSLGTPADGTVDETKLKDALIGDFTDATVTASDTFLHGDASDSGNTKRDTIQGILDLATSDPARNFIIDGDFTIFPEGDKTSIANGQYTSALVNYTTVGTAVHDASQDTDVPTYAQSGHQSKYSLKIDTTTADTGLATNEGQQLRYNVTGSDYTALHQQQVTLSFWHKHTKTGTFCCYLQNSAGNRSYVFEYTQSTTDTWEQHTETITLDSSGTWLFTEADIGLRIGWVIAYDTSGSFVGSADTWTGSDIRHTSNQVNGSDNTSNNFRLAQVGLYLGSSAPSGFVAEPIATVKDQVDWYVQRYDFTVTSQAIGIGVCAGTALIDLDFKFRRELRATPTITKSGTAGDFSGSDAGASAVMTSTSTFEADKLNFRFRGQQGGSTWTEGRAGKIYNTGANDTWIMADARH